MRHDSETAYRWDDEVSRWLISRAARRAPRELSARLEEEWCADLMTRDTRVAKLCFAIGCCWATRVIAYEHQPAMIRAVLIPVPKTSSAVLQRFAGPLSARSTTFLVVILAHCGVFYWVYSSVVLTLAPHPPTEMQNISVGRHPPVEPAPQIAGTKLREPVHLDPKLAEVSIPRDQRESLAEDVITESTGSEASVPPPTRHETQRVAGGPDSGFPNPDDYYLELSRPMGEQGSATIQVCVNRRGQLTAEPTVVTSSGARRLDAAALTLARAGSGHYRAGAEDGVLVDSCFAFRVRFQLKH